MSSPSHTTGLPNLGVFVLTMEQPGGPRRAHATRELDRLGIPFSFVQGVDPASTEIDQAYSRLLNWMRHKRSLTRGEVSVYLGHRKIWQEATRAGVDFALILEDDFKIRDDEQFLLAINDALSHEGIWSIVKFFDYNHKKVVEAVRIGTTQLVGYKYPASGAVAYLIREKAIRSFLRRRYLFRPIDEDFSHPWEFSIRVWSTSRNLVDEVSFRLGGSTLETERWGLRHKKIIIRSIWGNFLQGGKLTRSLFYRWANAAKVRTIMESADACGPGKTPHDRLQR